MQSDGRTKGAKDYVKLINVLGAKARCSELNQILTELHVVRFIGVLSILVLASDVTAHNHSGFWCK